MWDKTILGNNITSVKINDSNNKIACGGQKVYVQLGESDWIHQHALPPTITWSIVAIDDFSNDIVAVGNLTTTNKSVVYAGTIWEDSTIHWIELHLVLNDKLVDMNITLATIDQRNIILFGHKDNKYIALAGSIFDTWQLVNSITLYADKHLIYTSCSFRNGLILVGTQNDGLYMGYFGGKSPEFSDWTRPEMQLETQNTIITDVSHGDGDGVIVVYNTQTKKHDMFSSANLAIWQKRDLPFDCFCAAISTGVIIAGGNDINETSGHIWIGDLDAKNKWKVQKIGSDVWMAVSIRYFSNETFSMVAVGKSEVWEKKPNLTEEGFIIPELSNHNSKKFYAILVLIILCIIGLTAFLILKYRARH